MPDHDPLASLFEQAIAYGIEVETDYWGNGADKDRYIVQPAASWAAAARDAGYEVRPKLTAERLAAALHPHYGPGLCLSEDQHEWPGCDSKDEWYSDAAAILAIIDGEAT
jgi:hypothetical protein